jgi:hypothetical protein
MPKIDSTSLKRKKPRTHLLALELQDPDGEQFRALAYEKESTEMNPHNPLLSLKLEQMDNQVVGSLTGPRRDLRVWAKSGFCHRKIGNSSDSS